MTGSWRELELSRRLLEISEERILRSSERLAITYNYVYMFLAHSLLGAAIMGLILLGHSLVVAAAAAWQSVESLVSSAAESLGASPPDLIGKGQAVSMLATLLGIVIGVFGVISQLFSFEYGSETIMKRPLSIIPRRGAQGRRGWSDPWNRWANRIEVYFPGMGNHYVLSAEKGLSGLLLLSVIILAASMLAKRWTSMFEIALLILSLAVASATVTLAWLTTMVRPPILAFLHSMGYAGPEPAAYNTRPGPDDLFYSPYYMLSRGKLARIARTYTGASLFTLSTMVWFAIAVATVLYSAPIILAEGLPVLAILVEFTLGILVVVFSLSLLGVPALHRFVMNKGMRVAGAVMIAVAGYTAFKVLYAGEPVSAEELVLLLALPLALVAARVVFALSYGVAGSTPLNFKTLTSYMYRLLTARTAPGRLATIKDLDYEIAAVSLAMAYVTLMHRIRGFEGTISLPKDVVEEMLSNAPTLSSLVIEYLKTQHVVGTTILISATTTLKCLDKAGRSETPLYASAILKMLDSLLHFRLFASSSVDAQLVEAIDEAAASLTAVALDVSMKYPQVVCQTPLEVPNEAFLRPLDYEMFVEHVRELTQRADCPTN